MAEINMVPLIDVMLVLLVIFIVTAPLLTHAVKLELPRPARSPTSCKPDKIDFAIDAARASASGTASRSPASRRPSVLQAGQRQPLPEIHLRADQAVAYRAVAETLADAIARRADPHRLRQRTRSPLSRPRQPHSLPQTPSRPLGGPAGMPLPEARTEDPPLSMTPPPAALAA
jgi:biopolymer transport protein ExbD